MFNSCYSLKQVPVISENITNIDSAFFKCHKLSGLIEIKSENITNATNCFSSCNGKIILKVNKDTTTYKTIKDAIEEYKWENVYFDGNKVVDIVCWGDSLTAGSGGKGYNYEKRLKELAGNRVYISEYGIGGEIAQSIAMRQGGIPIYVEQFIIPPTTESVDINIKDIDGNEVILARDDTKKGLNPCNISGIEGTIDYNEDTLKYEFKRLEFGSEVKVKDNTQVITHGMESNRNDLMIIWAGTNNEEKTTTELIEVITDSIDSMLKYSNNSNYIVIGLTGKLPISDIIIINQKLLEKYGEHFLDIREYILRNGLKDAGIEATQQDIKDVKNGKIPTSLRNDNVHLNNRGYELVGEQVYNKLVSMGYIAQ